MTVQSTVPFRKDYTADGSTNIFAYPFQIFEAGDLTIYLNGVVKTLNTDYTVSDVGNASGGNITFTMTDSNNNPINIANNDKISIVMDMDLDRDTNYQPSGAFLASTVNNDFDRLWLATNQQAQEIDRSLRLKADDITTSNMEIPAKDDRKGKLLGFNATTGDPEVSDNNKGNWNAAYNDIITSASFSGGNYTLTQRDGGTITTSLDGRYLKLSGGNVTGTTRFIEGLLVDQNKAIAFNGSQLVMGTSGTESFIIEGGAGDLSIDAANLNLRASPTVNYITATNGGAVSLYHNNSVKLATTSGGISVTGTITATGYNSSNWDTAYNDKINSVSYSNNTLTLTQQDGSILTTTIAGGGGGGETLAQTLAIGNTTGGNDISFGDNDKANFGASDDLQIYHDGSNSYIKDSGTGNLRIAGQQVDILNPDANEFKARFLDNGAVELYYDNSKKLATTSTGIDVTGDITLSGNVFTDEGFYGNRVWNEDNSDLRFATNNTEKMRITSTGNVGIGTTSPDAPLEVQGSVNGVHEVHIQNTFDDDDGTGNNPSSKLRLSAASNNGYIECHGAPEDNASNHKLDIGSTAAGSFLTFSPANSESMRVTSSGNVGIGTTSPRNQLTVGLTTDSADDQNATVGIKCDANHQGIMLQENSGAEQWSLGVNADGDLNFYDSQVTTPTVTFKDNGGVGIGTTSPDGKLHVYTSDSGATVNSNADDLVIESATNAGISILGDGNETQYLMFGDAANSAVGRLQYSHADNHMGLYTNGSERLRINSSGNVGIGTTSPTRPLDVSKSGSTILANFKNTGGTTSFIALGNTTSTADQIRVGSNGTALTLSTNYTERMRINSGGSVGIGTDSPLTNLHVEGSKSADNVDMMRIKNTSANNGRVITFYKGSNFHGNIGLSSIQFGQGVYVSSAGGGLKFQNQFSSVVVEPCSGDGGDLDDAVDLGRSTNRFDDIYATNGTIQTSDRNLKQDIESLTDAEQRVAVAAKGLLRKFRWTSAVEEKGDDARIHFGIIAQDLRDAFTAEGLDAGRYAMFTSTTWWEHEGEKYYESDHAPEGATEHTRLGVRYSELLAFIISSI